MTSVSIFDKKGKHGHVHKQQFCKNCGKHGHMHRFCRDAKTSLGIILYYFTSNNDIKFLMIRRRNSIGFVQFIRGKFCETDTEYIQRLFDEMSVDEKMMIQTQPFQSLWKHLWANNMNKNQKNDYLYAVDKFRRVHVQKYIENSKTAYPETEWGFPKGRRDLRESNLEAAKREFTEETGIPLHILDVDSTRFFVEKYKGSDNVYYKHIYYLSAFKEGVAFPNIDSLSSKQILEVSKVGFYTLTDALDKIREYHDVKKQVLVDVYTHLRQHQKEKYLALS